MSNPNDHISKFLDYYCKLDQPEYAVLLNGVWGIGKTHFIDNFIDNQYQEELKFYRISLFGMKNIQELNSEIFSQLHPKIGSKGAQLVYRTMLSALPSVSINADIDGDEKNEGSGRFDISKVAEVFGIGEQKGKKGAVFIFDDLERTNIPTKQILGFLNRYVETFKQKVIVIANEEEIEKETLTINHDTDNEHKQGNNIDGKKQKADKTSYQIQKEKLIGKTFLLEPETRLAIPKIVDSLKNDSFDVVNNVYSSNIANIIQIFEESGYKNLRFIKHGLRDFIRLYDLIEEKFRQKNKGIIDDLLVVHLTLTIEKNATGLKKEDFAALNANNYMWDNSTIDDLNKKYSLFDSKHILLNGETWNDIIFDSKMEKKEINSALSKLTSNAYMPAWQILWNYWEISNEEFNNALNDVTNLLEDHKMNSACDLLQSFGLLVRFSSEKLYPKKKMWILQKAKNNFEANKTEILNQFNEETFWGEPSCGSHQIVGHETRIVRYFWAYLRKQYENHVLNEAQKEINEIFNQVEHRYEDWKKALRSGPWGSAKYHDLAVLNAIDEVIFVDKLCYKIPAPDRRRVLHTVTTRIDKNKILDEISWISKVIVRIEAELGKGEFIGIEAYQLKKWTETLKKECE